jgi:hypothetical protein
MADGSPAAASAAYPGPAWAMIDCKPTVYSELDNATTTAACETSAGMLIRVSLDLAAPPRISYVHLQIPGWTTRYRDTYGIPLVIGGDRDLLLLKMRVPKGEWSSTIDLFVYNAAVQPPSLSRLPPSPFDNPRCQTTGIVRHGDGEEYAVVMFDKKIVNNPLHCSGAEVVVYKPAAGCWDTRELCFPDSHEGVGPSTWQADVVIPFPEQRCVCWVDYSKGMLLYSVVDEFPVPTFYQLPATDLKARLRRHCLREHRRTVCVSQGKLRFVDADYGSDPQRTSGFTVSKWTFRMSPQESVWSWEEDGDALQVDRLWALPQYREKHLPLWIPEFPVISKQDHHIVNFLMQDPETFTPASLITINMRTMEFLSCMPYTNAQEDGSLKDICMYTAFISIELPKCHKLLSQGSVLVQHA